jgi:hypothetical protein
MREPEAIARRAWRRTALITAAGAAVGVVIGVLLGSSEHGLVAVLTIVGFGASAGGLAGTFAMLATTFRTSRAMQEPIAGLDPAERATLSRAITTGTPIEPPDSELADRAREHARQTGAYQPLVLGQFLLLYAGIAGPQIPRLVAADTSGTGISRFICSMLLIVALIMTPVMLRTVRRARRYVRAATATVTGR